MADTEYDKVLRDYATAMLNLLQGYFEQEQARDVYIQKRGTPEGETQGSLEENAQVAQLQAIRLVLGGPYALLAELITQQTGKVVQALLPGNLPDSYTFVQSAILDLQGFLESSSAGEAPPTP